MAPWHVPSLARTDTQSADYKFTINKQLANLLNITLCATNSIHSEQELSYRQQIARQLYKH